MHRVIKTLEAIVLVALVVVCYEAIKILRSADILIKEAQVRLVDVSRNTNALLIQTSLVADNVRRATENQNYVTRKTLEILEHTDLVVNEAGLTIAQMHNTIATTDGNTQQVLIELKKTLVTTNDTVTKLGVTIDSADKRITSKDIDDLLKNLNTASGNISEVAKHADEDVQTAGVTLKRVDDKVKQLTKPVNMFKSALTQAFGWTANVFTIFKKKP